MVPGLLHIDESAPDMHATNNTFEAQLADLRYEDLCPGSQALRELQEEFR